MGSMAKVRIDTIHMHVITECMYQRRFWTVHGQLDTWIKGNGKTGRPGMKRYNLQGIPITIYPPPLALFSICSSPSFSPSNWDLAIS